MTSSQEPTAQDAPPITPRTPTLRRNTREKILTGTLSAIAEGGVSKLSMTSICRHAGVSRATLYQYFSKPEDVLEVVTEQTLLEFKLGLQVATQDCAEPWERFHVILRYLNDHARVQSLENLMRHDSQFAIETIRKHFDYYLDSVQTALNPVVDAVQAELGCTLDRRLCAEVLLRNQFSAMLIPSKEQWLEQLPALVPIARAWLSLRK